MLPTHNILANLSFQLLAQVHIMVGILGQVVFAFLLGGQARLPVLLDGISVHLFAILDHSVLFLAVPAALVLTIVAFAQRHHVLAQIARRSHIHSFADCNLIAQHLASQLANGRLVHGERRLAPDAFRIRGIHAQRYNAGSAFVFHISTLLPDKIVVAASCRMVTSRQRVAKVTLTATGFAIFLAGRYVGGTAARAFVADF